MCIIVYRCLLRHNAENYKRNKKKWDGQTMERKKDFYDIYNVFETFLAGKLKE